MGRGARPCSPTWASSACARGASPVAPAPGGAGPRRPAGAGSPAWPAGGAGRCLGAGLTAVPSARGPRPADRHRLQRRVGAHTITRQGDATVEAVLERLMEHGVLVSAGADEG